MRSENPRSQPIAPALAVGSIDQVGSGGHVVGTRTLGRDPTVRPLEPLEVIRELKWMDERSRLREAAPLAPPPLRGSSPRQSGALVRIPVVRRAAGLHDEVTAYMLEPTQPAWSGGWWSVGIRSALLAPLQFFVVFCAGWINREQQSLIGYLETELAVWKELHGEKRPALDDGQRRRLALAAKELGNAALAQAASIVTPETIRAWYRRLVAEKYSGVAGRRPGRPRTTLEELILRLARENETWGYTRIQQAINASPISREVSRATVERVLKRNGVEPAPDRSRKTSWPKFLAVHWDALVAADFFTVEVLTWSRLVRYHVLFFIELATRRVHLGGITCDPCEQWLLQVARNVTDAFGGVLREGRYLILDRDPVFTARFRGLFEAHGVTVKQLPPRSPNLNAYAERWVRSIRTECLDRLIPLGEGHLRRAVLNFIAHHNHERTHQGLDGRLIAPEPDAGVNQGRIACRMRLGGLLRYYHRLAS
jgi:putative transposase